MTNDREFLSQLHAILERNFRAQDFGVALIAAQMTTSERQLQRRVRELTGQTPIQYIRSFRLQKSLDYLLSGMPIGKAANSVGFTSHAYFTSCFKAQYGITPNRLQPEKDSRNRARDWRISNN